MRLTLVLTVVFLHVACTRSAPCSPSGTWLVIDDEPSCVGDGCGAASEALGAGDAYTITVQQAGDRVHWLEPGADTRRIERKGRIVDTRTCEVEIVGSGPTKDTASRRVRFANGAFTGSRVQVGVDGEALYILSWQSRGARL